MSTARLVAASCSDDKAGWLSEIFKNYALLDGVAPLRRDMSPRTSPSCSARTPLRILCTHRPRVVNTDPTQLLTRRQRLA
mmetsp:Transcript_21764/g.60402  ORF Transcript_21764/g.60402 Transcript_21764/m.60402 type:complete len:80 (+) Transcript_21764:158-397(+)